MNPTVKSAMLLIPLGVMCFSSMAQSKKDLQDGAEKDKTILIRPNAESKEKFTIVVEGDKVTINGKPVDEFKSKDVDITRGSDAEQWGVRSFGLAPGISPFRGGWNMAPSRPAPLPRNKALLGVKTEKGDLGAVVIEVSPESAAGKAGLEKGDIITRLNDADIKDAESLYAEVGKYEPGDKVNITYSRESKSYTAAVVLEKNTAPAPRVSGDEDERDLEKGDFDLRMLPRFGPERAPLLPEAYRKPKLGLQIQDTEENGGVKILNVTEDAPAAKAGLQKDDIITSVNGKPVRNGAELKGLLKEMEKSGLVNITYKRGNKVQQATIKIPKKLAVSDL